MDRIAGPIIAIVFIIALGTGAYAFTLNQRVINAEAEVAVANQKAVTALEASQDAGHRWTESKVALSACQTQLQGGEQAR